MYDSIQVHTVIDGPDDSWAAQSSAQLAPPAVNFRLISMQLTWESGTPEDHILFLDHFYF